MIICFKTVWFHSDTHKPELPTLVNFGMELFPYAHIVLNLRSNTQEQCSSQKAKFVAQENKDEEASRATLLASSGE
jgi:hypothetical protein